MGFDSLLSVLKAERHVPVGKPPSQPHSRNPKSTTSQNTDLYQSFGSDSGSAIRTCFLLVRRGKEPNGRRASPYVPLSLSFTRMLNTYRIIPSHLTSHNG